MRLSKQMGRIAWLTAASLSLLSGNGAVCQQDSHYYLEHFRSAERPEAFNLEWAECEAKLGNDEGAMSAYERVLMINPDNEQAARALAKLYRKYRMDREAGMLNETLGIRRSMPVKQKTVSMPPQDSRPLVATHFTATLAAGYDDNLNFGIHTVDLGTLTENLRSFFHAFDLSGSYVNELSGEGGFSFRSNFGLYWQDNHSAPTYNMLYGSLDMGLGYETSRFLLYAPLVYRRMGYFNTDLYQQYGIAPRLTLKLRTALLMEIGAEYLKRRYLDNAYTSGDDTLKGVSVGLTRFFGKHSLYLRGAYGRYDADRATPALFTNHQYYQLQLGINYALRRIGTLGLQYRYTHNTYEEGIGTGTRKRKDDLNQVTLSLIRSIAKDLQIVASYTWAHNSSNYPSTSYTKRTATFGLRYVY